MSQSTVVYPPALASFFEQFAEASNDDQTALRGLFELYVAFPREERKELLLKHSLLSSFIAAVRAIRVHDDFCRNAIHPFIDEVFERSGIRLSRDRIFELIFIHSLWGPGESPSGQGSYLEATRSLRVELPKLLTKYGIRSMVDAACGDFNWMKEMDISGLLDICYGIDIVPTMIAENQSRYAGPNLQFLTLDLVTTTPPRADLIFCRHLLQHLTFDDCEAVLANFWASGSNYLLVTTVPDVKVNEEVLVTGAFRKLNLEISPFNLGPRLDALSDKQRPNDPTLLALYSLR